MTKNSESRLRLESETSDEIYSALLDLSTILITPQGMTKNSESRLRLESETSDEIYSALLDLSTILITPQGMTKEEICCMPRKVIARIPASTTNLGPGFDVLGLALQLYSTITLETTATGTEVVVSGVDADKMPSTPEHIAFQAVEFIFKQSGVKRPKGFKLSIANGIPAIRGLGGSGTAVLGGLLTANVLCGTPFSDAELLNFATELEGHPDNVAASLFGGLVVSAQEDAQVHTVRLECPDALHIVLAIPDFPLSTEQARQVLPKSVGFEDAIYNTSRSTLLIASIATGQFEMLPIAMKDRLHQPYRTSLIPGFDDVAEAATAAGAISVALSGAGPTVAAYCLGYIEQVAKQMQTAFNKHQIACDTKILKPDAEGANVFISA